MTAALRSLAHVVVYLTITVVLAACAAPWRTAAIIVATSDRAIAEGAADFQKLDAAKERAIVDADKAAGKPEPMIRADVDAWRKISDGVVLAYKALADATGAAMAAILKAASGAGPVSAIAAALLPALRALVDALTAAGVTLPASISMLLTLVGG